MDAELLKRESDERRPPVVVRRRSTGSQRPIPGVNVHLLWVDFTGEVPPWAVSIWNDYIGKTVYVCRVYFSNRSGSGYHIKGKSVCLWPYGEKELAETTFEILTNDNDLEILEWRRDSYGQVPSNALATFPGLHIGRNRYGLGKVCVENQAFFVSCNGYEYWYKRYEVLTMSTQQFSQSITDVHYDVASAKVRSSRPQSIQTVTTENLSCEKVTKTAELATSLSRQMDWRLESSMTFGEETSITAGIPDASSMSLTVTAETTHTISEGKSVSETIKFHNSVTIPVPSLHRCTASIVGVQSEVSVPYSATVTRVYETGARRGGPIAGIYYGVTWSDVKIVVSRCDLIADAKPC
ncbi:LOW QUALITY PROTEIN: natterin-3-like [Lethenteron reissneri]|uniref:LOW QUALITY PROTEIN: natterin-3-like n=1 Tax=Lethenteron reissneri TaxID=7753 RepID=UPI002AB7BCF1|nr:LOW QUALITY PROTEIN: natterin-3-like [Lethenteron reissneri]